MTPLKGGQGGGKKGGTVEGQIPGEAVRNKFLPVTKTGITKAGQGAKQGGFAPRKFIM